MMMVVMEGGEADEGRDAGGEPEEKDFHMELRSRGAIEQATTSAPTPQQGRQASVAHKASASAVMSVTLASHFASKP